MEYIHGKSLIKIAIADDHNLIRESLCKLINDWDNCKIVAEAPGGQELIERIDSNNLPDLAIIDLSMKGMNGYETIAALRKRYPIIKFLVISMYHSEYIVTRIIKAGAMGYVNKSEDPGVFKRAVNQMMRNGYYFSDQAAARIVNQILHNKDYHLAHDITDEEIKFLKHAVTDKSYGEIAKAMDAPLRHIEHLRKKLFDRLGVRSRAGLIALAIEKGLTI